MRMKSLMSKYDYLNDNNVSGFIEYLSKLDTFKHHYNITKKSNTAWIEHNNRKSAWSCDSFDSAKNQYFWNNKDFDTNEKELNQYSLELQAAIKGKKDKDALCKCLDIANWGGVTNGAYGIARLYCNGNLIQTLNEALDALTPDDSVYLDLSGFLDGRFIMNATLTKIYSLLSEKPFIIYDSRVAASLGLLVKKYWLDSRTNSEVLPGQLAFACLEGRAVSAVRDASDETKGVIFRKVRNDVTHALWNVRANWVIEAALRRKGVKEDELIKKMREIEAALFMIGYTV